jgi:hypothetical protein
MCTYAYVPPLEKTVLWSDERPCYMNWRTAMGPWRRMNFQISKADQLPAAFRNKIAHAYVYIRSLMHMTK